MFQSVSLVLHSRKNYRKAVNEMYDEIVKSIDLTYDEITILKGLLFYRLNECVSIGEEITVRNLIEKL